MRVKASRVSLVNKIKAKRRQMKRLNIKLVAVAISLVLSGVIGIGRVVAASRAIMLSPMNQKMVLYPGETYHGTVTVANPNDAETDLHYLATLSTYYPAKIDEDDKYYKGSDFETKSSMNMIVDWTEIDNPTGVLEPNDEIQVSFTINVPETAPAGGQYMAILVKEDPEFAKKDDNSVNVNEIMQMAHIVYAEVAGETRNEGAILENDIPSFLVSNTLEATSAVQNNGNVHTDAEFILQVWPMGSDEEICTNEEDASTGFVMPGTETYHVETCQLPAVGIFRAKQTVKIFGETSIVEKTIIVCPIWLLFLIIFVIVAAIIYFVMRARARKGARRTAE